MIPGASRRTRSRIKDNNSSNDNEEGDIFIDGNTIENGYNKNKKEVAEQQKSTRSSYKDSIDESADKARAKIKSSAAAVLSDAEKDKDKEKTSKVYNNRSKRGRYAAAAEFLVDSSMFDKKPIKQSTQLNNDSLDNNESDENDGEHSNNNNEDDDDGNHSQSILDAVKSRRLTLSSLPNSYEFGDGIFLTQSNIMSKLKQTKRRYRRSKTSARYNPWYAYIVKTRRLLTEYKKIKIKSDEKATSAIKLGLRKLAFEEWYGMGASLETKLPDDVLNPPDGEIDFNKVFCAICKSFESEGTQGDIVICDHERCGKAFHQRCQQPFIPVYSIDNDEKDFYCRRCEYFIAMLNLINDDFNTDFDTCEEIFPEVQDGKEMQGALKHNTTPIHMMKARPSSPSSSPSGGGLLNNSESEFAQHDEILSQEGRKSSHGLKKNKKNRDSTNSRKNINSSQSESNKHKKERKVRHMDSDESLKNDEFEFQPKSKASSKRKRNKDPISYEYENASDGKKSDMGIDDDDDGIPRKVISEEEVVSLLYDLGNSGYYHQKTSPKASVSDHIAKLGEDEDTKDEITFINKETIPKIPNSHGSGSGSDADSLASSDEDDFIIIEESERPTRATSMGQFTRNGN